MLRVSLGGLRASCVVQGSNLVGSYAVNTLLTVLSLQLPRIFLFLKLRDRFMSLKGDDSCKEASSAQSPLHEKFPFYGTTLSFYGSF